MLDYTLLENVAAAGFSGRRFMRALRDALVSSGPAGTSDRAAFVERCWTELGADVEEYSPRRFRLDDIDLALRTLWPHTMFYGKTGHELPLLDSLFDRFFVHDGAGIRYRVDEVEGYVRCAGRIDPAIVVAWHIAGTLRADGTAGRAATQALVEGLQPFFSPQPQGTDAYAENHAHLLGTHYDGLVLMSTLAAPPTGAVVGLDARTLAVLAEFRTLQEFAQGFLHTAFPAPGSADTGIETLCAQVLSPCHVLAPRGTCDMTRFEELAEPDSAGAFDWLRHLVSRALRERAIERAWIWFLVWCWYQYRDPDCPPRRRIAVCYLLGTLMGIRRRLMMDGYGLARFVTYYNDKLRKVVLKEAKFGSAAGRLFQGPADLAEIKVGAGMVAVGSTRHWLRQALGASGCTPAASGVAVPPSEHAQAVHAYERWHYSIHLFRAHGMEKNIAGIWASADEIAGHLASTKSWEAQGFMTASPTSPGRLWPSRWIRTLDVAGNENLGKIEFYAPALRWLRDGGSGAAVPEAGKPAARRLALSIHAGEDYAHPLSGMRHIDETVRFCGMTKGDRLGHALALGIRPRDWFDSHGNAVVPVDEYVDNLVWAWQRGRGFAGRFAWAAQALARIERALRLLLPHVEWASFVDGRVPLEDVLAVQHRAWRLRRNCHGHAGGELPDTQGKHACAVPDRRRIGAARQPAQSLAAILYERRWRALKGSLSLEQLLGGDQPARMNVLVRQDGGARPPRIETHATGPVAVVTVGEEELAFMEALQDRLLASYARLGLVFETNPTSNVYIAQLKSHAEHPIFRWHPPDAADLGKDGKANRYGLRQGAIKVCVNTDDPALMPTTLRTEFALLRDAAQRNGYEAAAVDAWLERLRLAGVDEFNDKHETVWA